jgi:tRNA G46 methylase TrmB
MSDAKLSARGVAGNSRAVQSNQTGPHAGLEALLKRHARSAWQQPLHTPTVEAFAELQGALEQVGWSAAGGNPHERAQTQPYLDELGHRPGHSPALVLDAGCGTGESTLVLSQLHPGCVVIGVDQSADRLSRVGVRVGADGAGVVSAAAPQVIASDAAAPAMAQSDPPTPAPQVLWLRAELATFWRLALAAGWSVETLYLLYPNPWPKKRHLQRRWHGHPVFPDLLRLSQRIVLRSNWGIYTEEFSLAAQQLGAQIVSAGLVLGLQNDTNAASQSAGANAKHQASAETSNLSPLTPFERKYAASGHELHEVVVDCHQID